MIKVAVEILREFMVSTASTLILGRDQAETMVDNVLVASLWGINSHGIVLFPHYLGRLRKGLTNNKPNIRINHTFPAVLSVDGDNGLGSVVTMRALEAAIAVADQYGVALAGIKNSNHFGIAGYYCNLASKLGYVLLISSVGPPNMAPHGSMEEYFSTNPFAVGMPRKDGSCLIVDMATSVSAKGRVREYARQGLTIPEGWALDKEGHSTIDANAAIEGIMLPMAGHKGSAIALAIEYLAGVATGAGIGKDIPNAYGNETKIPNVGHSMVIYRPDAMLPDEEHYARIERMCHEIKMLRPSTGFERVVLPGELEFNREDEHKKNGLSISDELFKELINLGKDAGVDCSKMLKEKKRENNDYIRPVH